VRIGQVTGTVHRQALVEKVAAGEAQLSDEIAKFMVSKPAIVGLGETVQIARDRLASEPLLLALSDGEPVGVLTRSDLPA
ncbi:MAG: hypothetical protein RI933_782, partial [Actinomycetota bacterium]